VENPFLIGVYLCVHVCYTSDVRIHVYICVYQYLHVCLYAWMSTCTYVRTHACMNARMHACDARIYVRMHAYMGWQRVAQL